MKTKHLSAALLLPSAAVAAEIREYSRDAAFIEDYRRGALAALALPVEMGWVGLKDMVPFRLGVAVRNDQVTGAASDLALVMIAPEVVVERIVVQPDDSVFSYFGPPERRWKQ